MTSLPARKQYLPENDGVIVHLVMGGIYKRDCTVARQVAQSVEFSAMPVDLRRISLAELFPAGRIMPEPFPQFRARREFFRPMVNRRVRLLDPSRPKPVDQNTSLSSGS